MMRKRCAICRTAGLFVSERPVLAGVMALLALLLALSACLGPHSSAGPSVGSGQPAVTVTVGALTFQPEALPTPSPRPTAVVTTPVATVPPLPGLISAVGA